jgi:type IX secretion system PorP/SprF family membrane protein
MKKIIILIPLIIAISIKAQQIPQLSLRHLNMDFFNPAVNGSYESPNIKLLHRQQWVGFENAPKTSFISYSMPINSSNSIGGFLINDKTYPGTRFTINLGYSYVIPIDNLNLSFGLSALIVQYRLDNQGLTYRDESDPAFNFVSDKKWRPESNAGIYVYNDDFKFGFAIDQILKSSFRPFAESDNAEIRMSRHIIFSGEYKFYSNLHSFIPGIFISYASSSPVAAELCMSYNYAEKIHGILNYKYNDGLNIGLGYYYDIFGLFYSYDLVLSSLRYHTSGSHEVMLTVKLKNSNKQNMPMFRN